MKIIIVCFKVFYFTAFKYTFVFFPSLVLSDKELKYEDSLI